MAEPAPEPETMPEPAPGSRWSRFGPVVLAGIGGAALCAVTSAKPWWTANVDARSDLGVAATDTRAEMPLALALALVVLAAWGVVLVSRTRGRRVALALAVPAALGVLACAVAAPSSLPGQLRDRIDLGDLSTSPTGWYVAAVAGALLTLAAAAVGFRAAPSWPSMSARYDAPGGAPVARDETDLWKSLDAGVDPTADDPPPSP